ncbi:replication factor C large subunit [Candidatus Bathyarchaeota archaeon A05DMB-2]|nr:replication factor C large subunit [Candidatus Bathyarchaeota archaeon A05DMB-2]
MKNDVLWVEKYRPQKIADVIGNEEAKATFVEWLKSKCRKKKAVLLYGPPGVGKTALVNAAANEFGFRIIEMNASDTRTEKAINKVAAPATSFVGLDTFSTGGKGNLVFLDEVDGVAGKEDRGGIGAIVRIVEESRVPVIMAANDPDLEKIRPLKKVSVLIRFHQVRIPLIIETLRRICRMEHVEAEFEALERIAQNSRGDMRSAINDLQSLAEAGKVLTLQDTMVLSSRNKDIGVEETLRSFFSVKSLAEAENLLKRSSVDHDELLMSVSDNLPRRYLNPVELAEAYDFVSRADMFRGRIGTENWHLLRYFYNSMAEAAAVSPESYKPFEFISPPIRIITLFWTKGKRTILDAICAKIALRCHVSRAAAKNDFVPFLKVMLQKRKVSPIASWLKLEPEEVDYLVKMSKF